MQGLDNWYLTTPADDYKTWTSIASSSSGDMLAAVVSNGGIYTYNSLSPPPSPTPPSPTPTPSPPSPSPIESYVIYQRYSTSDCKGNISAIVGYVQNVCIDSSDASSIVSNLYTCSNNVPYDNGYTGSATCNGTSVPYNIDTCTR